MDLKDRAEREQGCFGDEDCPVDYVGYDTLGLEGVGTPVGLVIIQAVEEESGTAKGGG